jgi:alpha-tubulin suppressor-like RCC1 family protein
MTPRSHIVVFTLLLIGAACGNVESSSDGDAANVDAAVGVDAFELPDAAVDAIPPPSCEQGGDICPDGSECFEGVCGGRKVVAISANCAVRASGTVWCWGYNEFGVTGDPATSDTCEGKPCRNEPTRVEGIDDVVSVTDDGASACAIRRDGTLWCWGFNSDGRLGHDPASDRTCGNERCTWEPQRVAGLENVQSVVTNYGTTCAVVPGALYCWGVNNLGQLGRGTTSRFEYAPGAVGGLPAPARVDIGVLMVCASTTSAQVWCWGWSTIYGNLGHADRVDPICEGDRRCASSPTRIATDLAGGAVDDVVDVAVGDVQACVVRRGGSLWCWGHGGYCQLGGANNDQLAHTAPIQIAGVPPAASVASKKHTCVRTTGGEVWCVGLNYLAQLGDGTLRGTATSAYGSVACTPTPKKVPLVSDTVALELRDHHSAALSVDGAIMKWGLNRFSQLGHEVGTSGDVACEAFQCNANPKPVVLP